MSAGKIAIATAAALVGATLWKGKNIRAHFSMTGDGWNKLHPEMKKRAAAILQDANAEYAGEGFAVGIYEGWRDVNTQRSHIASGASYVSNPLSSYHPWGLACDFVFLSGAGSWTWAPTGDDAKDRDLWYRLGEIIERHGLEWGGRWDKWGGKKFDGPHGQLPLFRTAQLKEKYTAPEAFITWA